MTNAKEACKDCEQTPAKCICGDVDRFFSECPKQTGSLAKLMKKDPAAARCLACYFMDCQCVRGLAAKRHK